jgi:hypothetical protein
MNYTWLLQSRGLYTDARPTWGEACSSVGPQLSGATDAGPGMSSKLCPLKSSLRPTFCRRSPAHPTTTHRSSQAIAPDHGIRKDPTYHCPAAREVRAPRRFHETPPAWTSTANHPHPPGRISEGQYYEAHQQLRVIANRYVKSNDWPSAISILASGAAGLLKAGQGGSGGDLCIFLVDVYSKAELKPDPESRARMVELLRAFPSGEPTRKRFVGDLIGYVDSLKAFPHALGGLDVMRWS